MSDKFAILLFGPPGSGKSTLAEWVQNEMNIKKLSGGTLLRELAQKNQGKDSVLARDAITKGGAADDDLIIRLYKREMTTDAKGYVFDGNISGINQALGLTNLFSKKKVEKVVIIKIICPKRVCLERIKSRLENRDDNSAKVIENRFKWYKTDVQIAFEYLVKQYGLALSINSKSLMKNNVASLVNVVTQATKYKK